MKKSKKWVVPVLCVTIGTAFLAFNQPPKYRDLNKNGKMDDYENAQLSIEKRIDNLISLMTIEEKAGMMFINGTLINDDGSIEKKEGAEGFAARLPTAIELIEKSKMNHFNYWQAPSIAALAKGYNAIQKVAENSRLGIPVTIASDPRHYFSNNVFAMDAKGFSQWPEQLGFAAIGDEKLMQQFGDIARQEYIAVGIKEALHPMADLATEPRWPRVSGTFGEDAKLSARMVKAYILGFQGTNGLNAQSVACMTKHFSGGGPQKEGIDPHFQYQKGQVYPGNNFNYHLIPFEAAFEAKTACMMPYYGVPTDQTSENVGFSYNKDIITTMLREKYKYDGVVCTDWGLVTDTKMGAVTWPARAWGVEHLTEKERVKKIIDSGCDQFGGENCPQHVVALVKEGAVSEKRIDQSIRRLLRVKFQLGLFENPYIDEQKALQIIGQKSFKELGEKTQRRAYTLLKNDMNLPLHTASKLKIYAKNISPELVSKYGIAVQSPEQADVAILRLNTPWVPIESDNFFARGFHHGDLDFKGKDLTDVLELCQKVPTIVDIYLDRPAVFPEINKVAKAVLANYGASDAALLDVVFGNAKPEGKLPFELPSTMDAVKKQKEDVPHDSENPLYPFGFGLKYKR
ncbi:glycoside hydrolase family 3 protein [Flavobacterium branchiophilum]|uniref:beta-glucosidase n=1 Tax=Flavobacterium branchiophilum TaxID=55197 RepID=A0A2H3KVW8_9FLAO|nr:glycoside hydrolase family 3 N-terminal domain-containing protein [Flavobacterium branchiophilum]PDS22994.1 beta-glucosidase [Flavobacterium branchiophilum]